MRQARAALHEFWIVLRGIWLNAALYVLLLLIAAVLLAVCGCYPKATFWEQVVTAFYMTRTEAVDGSNHHVLIVILVFLMPVLSLLILGEGVFRIASLYMSRKQRSPEWEELMVSTLSKHTVICGAGELGRALLLEILKRHPDENIVIVDTKGDILRELGIDVPNVRHITGDMTSIRVLETANVQAASILFLTSGNDAYNLETIQKALHLNPNIEIWVRLYRSGLSRFLDQSTVTNLHFFSPYQTAAEQLAAELDAPATTH
ncbi:MAG: NAD-binding protein [Armatimonadota bacterium]